MDPHGELPPDHVAYLAQRMTEVSRSFALVVPRVETPLGHHLAVAYMVCRVVDNVEDCAAPPDWRRDRFGELDRMLHDRAAPPRVLAAWARHTWPGLTLHEARLMSPEGGALLWVIYWRLPPAVRLSIRRWVQAMVRGMSGMAGANGGAWTSPASSVRCLHRVEDYNRYCFIVAGTVGRMATELAVEHYRLPSAVAERLRAHSDACGRGLQKTNIVKDFADDLSRGVCYLPDDWLAEVGRQPLALLGAPVDWTRRVLGDVLRELRDAVEYVRALPYAAVGYRTASLLCLLPAYETLYQAACGHESLFTGAHRVKIPRSIMARCLADAAALARDNDAVEAYGRERERRIEQALGTVAALEAR